MKVWLQDAELDMLHRLASTTELAKTDLTTRILAAGLRAICANDYRFSLPLEFALCPGVNPQSTALNVCNGGGEAT